MADFQAARRAMVDCQIRPADVTRYSLIDAMLKIPRERFVPKARREIAYAESEIEVAPGRMLMAPRIFAKMIEAADIHPDDLVLELCPASGYSTAVIASMAEMVVAIEPDDALAAQAQGLLEALGIDNAVISAGNPCKGDAAHAPFDLIFINGAIEELPEGLTDQLKDGGRIVTLIRRGAISACRSFMRSGRNLFDRHHFDGFGPGLEGFEKPGAFSF